jgi:plastocyanin
MVAHCVTEETTKAWTSSNIAAGASWKMAVNSSADYFCAIHLVMKGKIKIE